MGVGTRASAKKSKGNFVCYRKRVSNARCLYIPLQGCQQFVDNFCFELEEEELQTKTVDKIDAETQTDPEITGVDADDFEEDDGEGEETGSESSEDEDEDLEAGEDGQSKSVDRGTSSKPVRRKIIELKYYFGEDLPDAELTKREFGIYNFSPSTWSSCIN